MLWQYQSYSCNATSVSEQWLVCPEDGDSVCELGCSAIYADLLDRAGNDPSESEPAIGSEILGVGFRYASRPCDPAADAALYLDKPTISDGVEKKYGRCCKQVTLTWSQLPTNQATEPPSIQDPDQPIQDPEQWCPKISGGSVASIVAADTLEFAGIFKVKRNRANACCDDAFEESELESIAFGFDSNCANANIGDCMRPATTAGQPFDPPIELELSDWVYRIEVFRSCDTSNEFDESVFAKYQDRPNCDEYTLSIPCLCWKRTFPVRTAKIIEVSTSSQSQVVTNPVTGKRSTMRYFAVTISIAVRERGWHIDILNAGTQVCPVAGAPAVLTDPNGYSVDSVMLLDKAGHRTTEEWFHRYYRKCVPHHFMPILKDYAATLPAPPPFDPDALDVELRQSLLRSIPPSGTTVFDERTGLGDPRPRQPGRAANFDGLNDYIESQSIAAFTFPLTVAVWIRFNATGPAAIIMFNNGPVSYLSGLATFPDGRIVWYLGSSNYQFFATNSGTLLGWHHLAAVQPTSDAKDALLYLDGVVDGQGSAHTGTNFSPTMITLGKYNGAATGYIAGAMSDARVINDALSATQILQVMNEPDAAFPNTIADYKLDEIDGYLVMDSSGNGNDGTAIGITESSFRHEGSDVPHSAQNEVGFTKSLPRLSIVGLGSWLGCLVGSEFQSDFELHYLITLKPSAQDQFGMMADTADPVSATYQKASQAGWETRSSTSSTVLYNGLAVLTLAPPAVGDVYSLRRVGSTLTWELNGVVQHTETDSTPRRFIHTGSSTAFMDDIFNPMFGSLDPTSIYPINGATESTPYLIPRDESNPTLDILGNPLQFSGKAPANASLIQSHCATFDGLGGYIALPGTAAHINAQMTFGGWVSFVNAGNFGIVTKGLNNQWGLFIQGGVIKLRVDASYTVEYDPGDITGEWHHIAGVVDDTTATIYLGGVEVASGAVVVPAATSDLIQLGKFGTVYPLAGSLSGIGYWSRALLAEEIKVWHDDGDIPTADLFYPLAEGMGDQFYDIGATRQHGVPVNMPTAWSVKQDRFHANLTRGFTLYEHPTLPPIRVPFVGPNAPLSITPPPGYTKTHDSASGPWHNGAETQLDFTAGVAAPGTAAWNTAWQFVNDRTNPEFRRKTTRFTRDYRADRFLTYAEPLSGSELTDATAHTAENDL